MEAVNQLLREAGVLGGFVDSETEGVVGADDVFDAVVDEFGPEFQLDVIYGHKRISPGDTVAPIEVQHRPDRFEFLRDPSHPEIVETFRHPTFITVVMTDPDAVGGEHLHWLSTAALQAPVMQWQDLVTYEPPRGRLMGSRKIVYIVYKSNEALPNIIVPESRNNFSSRFWAYHSDINDDPLAVTFFKIIGPVENGYSRITSI